MNSSLISGIAILLIAIGAAHIGAVEPSPVKRQVVFSLTPAQDGRTVNCSFAKAQDVNYATHEVRDTDFLPSATFVERACAKFIAQYWHTWDFMKGKPGEDFCFWSEETPNIPVFPIEAPM